MVKATAFYSLISEVTHHDFCHVLLVRHTNFGTMRDSQGHEYQEVGTIDDGYREANHQYMPQYILQKGT